MVGLEWIALSSVETDNGAIAVPIMFLAVPPGNLPGRDEGGIASAFDVPPPPR
jgi:hypothetical protein